MGVEFIKTILYSAQTHTLFFVSEAGSFVIPCIFYRSIPLFMPLYYSVSFYWALSSSFQHFHSPPVSFSPNLFLQTPFHLFFHLGLCLSLDRFPVSGPPRHQCTGNGWGKSWVPPPLCLSFPGCVSLRWNSNTSPKCFIALPTDGLSSAHTVNNCLEHWVTLSGGFYVRQG